MGKKRYTEDTWRKDPWFRGVVDAFRTCKSDEDIENLLRDIGTLSELQAWSERLEVAKQLSRGLSYRQIAANTGASTTTVTRVAHFLENGAGGYRKSLKTHRHHRMGAEVREQSERSAQGSIPQTSERETKHVSVLQKYL